MHLTDLLVSLALVGLVVGSTMVVLREGQRSYDTGAARIESQQTARLALARLAQEIRGAGRGGHFAAISVAQPQRLVLHHDLDGDGRIAALGETVVWRLAGRVLRRDAGGGAQPIVNGVQGFVLEYFDEAGGVTSTPADVRSVRITLTTEPDDLAAGRQVAARLTTEVRLRNR